MSAAKRVAIYGGSFNPPHLCHQFVLLAVLETAEIDEIWLTPTAQHPFAKTLAPYAMRRRWCEALIEPFGAKVSICDIEAERQGPSYTLDTLDELAGRYPDMTFSLVLGSDQRAAAARWKRFDEIERRFPIHWIGRAGSASDGDPLVLPDISSTEVRRRLALGLSVAKLVPRRVRQAIESSGFSFDA